MQNKILNIISLGLIFLALLNPVLASSDRDPSTGAIVGGGILGLCQPTENKACIFMDNDTITVRVRESGVTNEYLYNLYTCKEDWRGNTNCNFNSLTISADNIQLVTRGRDEFTFGKDQVYVNLLGRNERVILNGQMVPQTFHLNIGQGRVGTSDTKFSLRFGDNTLGFGSDTIRRTGIEYFMFQNTPYTQYTVGTISRDNLLHKLMLNIDPKNDPNKQYITLDIGSIIVKIIHENPLNLDLGNVNNGKGPVGSTQPNPNPNPNPNPTPNPHLGTFEIDADGDRFFIRSTVPSTLVKIRSILAGTDSININNARFKGDIASGTKPYNSNWGFFLEEDSIEVFTGTDYSCDGSAKVINRNIGNVGSYDFLFERVWCPNTSKIIREIF